MRWNAGLNRYHYLVLAIAAMGWMFDTMDQWLYVWARQSAVAELLKAETTDPIVKQASGIVQTIFLIGWATGGFLFGILGDRLGRARTMAITIAMYAGFTGLSGLSQDIYQFGLLRFLTGLGVGGEFAAGAALVAEVFPDRARSTALAIMQSCSAIGNLAAAGMNFFVMPELGWRWMFFIGAGPAILLVLIRLFIKEPSAWQAAKDAAEREKQKVGSLIELLRDQAWRHSAFVGLGLTTVAVIGFWGISTWTPDLMRSVLNPDKLPELTKQTERLSSIGGMAQQAGAFFGPFAFAFVAARWGRRPAFGMSFLLCLVVAPATFYLTTSFATAMIWLPLLGFSMLTIFGGLAIYLPELFPTRLRATGIGLCYNGGRYLAAAGPWLFGGLSGAYGFQSAAMLVSSVFVGGLAVAIVARETKGRPLPE